MENVFHLEQLKMKRIPNKEQKDGIKIHNVKLQDSQELVIEEIIEENIEQLEEGEEPEKKPKIKILDYREKQQVDREMILDRLFNRKGTVETLADLKMAEKQNQLLSSEVITFKPKKPTKLSKKIIIDKEAAEKVEPEEELIEERERLIENAEKVAEEKDTEVKVTEEKEDEIVLIPRKRKVKKVEIEEEQKIGDIDLTKVRIGDTEIKNRLPKDTEKIIVKSSSYYMNSRKLFIQKINELFRPYRDEIKSNEETVSCTKSSKSTDIELLTHQKIVRDYLNLYSPYRGLLLYHGLGSGKCMKKDTPIIMYDGSTKMVQDIQVGELLMGDDSKPRTVLSLARGRDKMYDVIPIKGEKYTVNQEHILCLKASGFPKLCYNNHKSNTNYNIQWIEKNEFQSKTFTFNQENKNEMEMEAEKCFQQILYNSNQNNNILEIAIKDYLKLSNKKKGFLKGYKVPVEFPEKELPTDPYMIGYWLGAYGETVGSLYNTLKELKMINNKHIPMIYKCNSRENRLKLLAGLIDSDGSLNTERNGFEFTHTNEKLMDDVIFLARSLGFSCYKREKKISWACYKREKKTSRLYKGDKKTGNAFITCINGNGIEEIPTRKQALPRKQIKDALETGIKVEYVNEDEYYGFMLDENCRYLIGDFTVTHNTCTSIAIAEGMKSHKRIVVMTPASLKMNFFSELKKCGDHLYKKNQYWEFISTDGKPEYIDILQKVLNIPVEVIRKKRGAWLVDVTKASNFSDLETTDQKTIDEQLDYMIRSKYTDINYNGINMKQLKILTNNFTTNIFDNSVVIIDEAHNFVSRIVNKLPKKASSTATAKQKNSISYMLYKYLMDAKNTRVVLLTGTPIINYPNEIAILFNILRGYIKTWSFPVNVSTSKKVNRDTILDMFEQSNFKTYDYVEFSGGVLTITRNPYGFVNIKKRSYQTKKGGSTPKTKKHKETSKRVTKKNLPEEPLKIEEDVYYDYNKLTNYTGEFEPHQGGSSEVFDKYNGVKLDETGNINDDVFVDTVKRILAKNEIEVITGNITVEPYKCLPDESDSFLNMFIEPGAQKMKNENVFKRRILGLTSYFRSAQEKLLPQYVENENGGIFHIVRAPMSDYQFGIYERIRDEEEERDINLAKLKKQQAKKGGDDMFKISSTYRIFSRAACNFTFPDPPGRPMPPPKKKKGEITETDFDAVPMGERAIADDYVDDDDVEEMKEDEGEQVNYKTQIERALSTINTNEYLSLEGLQQYSPKFVQILQNIQDETNIGLHLLYSQFRTIEGVGILKMILEMNGYAQFKIQKNGDSWSIIEKEGDEGKPRFVLYTGTETAEEKEIIRNIYNSIWDNVPVSITTRLKEINGNNLYGEIIKVLMITASGAEGINLRNTRFVHIVEPYWHMVRIEQVVGRARRICSHEDLPEELRTIKVFLYLSVLSDVQKTDEKHIELRIRDVSKLDKKTPVTTDEALFEMSTIKDRINQQILTAIKETAMDCSLYSASNSKEHLVCYGYGKVDSNNFSSYPTLEQDQSEKDEINQQMKKLVLKPVEIEGIKYQWDDRTGNVFDHESVIRAKKTGEDLVFIGRLVRDRDRWRLDRNAERV